MFILSSLYCSLYALYLLSPVALLYLISLVALSDISAFFVGKKFGKSSFFKIISPNKTISGAIGSLFFSLVFASLLFFYLTKNFDFYIIIIGLFTSVSCQLGDLFFSFLKRKSFLKDTGNFLPGHGGILDRIDGLLLGVPVGFFVLLFIY